MRFLVDECTGPAVAPCTFFPELAVPFFCGKLSLYRYHSTFFRRCTAKMLPLSHNLSYNSNSKVKSHGAVQFNQVLSQMHILGIRAFFPEGTRDKTLFVRPH